MLRGQNTGGLGVGPLVWGIEKYISLWILCRKMLFNFLLEFNVASSVICCRFQSLIHGELCGDMKLIPGCTGHKHRIYPGWDASWSLGTGLRCNLDRIPVHNWVHSYKSHTEGNLEMLISLITSLD